ncbi:hypothetical protein BX600DRAFT_238347 [Xylariales sp. PMI_506]|nr:hypothetical protein BX600DRAFT_238347 [Xylariales sp. PMI_506]
MLINAVKEKDLDEVKAAIQKYVKSTPNLTYTALEAAFRQQDIGLYIIAVEKPQMSGALTNMDLQGNLGKKYQVTYRFDPRPMRAREAQFFPKDTEENSERLKDAGEPVNRGLQKCNNCNEYGHTAKFCTQEKVEKEHIVVKCFNCNEEGHRVRNCKMPIPPESAMEQGRC